MCYITYIYIDIWRIECVNNNENNWKILIYWVIEVWLEIRNVVTIINLSIIPINKSIEGKNELIDFINLYIVTMMAKY